MKRKRRTSITVETTRVVITSTVKGRLNWCPNCAAEVEMLTMEEAAIVAHSTAAQILQKTADQLLHSIQKPDQSVLICPNSLLK